MLTLDTDYVVQGHRFDILEDFGCNPVGFPASSLIPPLTHVIDHLCLCRGSIYRLHSASGPLARNTRLCW